MFIPHKEKERVKTLLIASHMAGQKKEVERQLQEMKTERIELALKKAIVKVNQN